jgi:hypothetical protein
LINFVASANTTSTPAATMVVTLPSHSEGDVIILSFVHNYNSAVQALTAVSDGYTELASLAISGLGHQASIWYKKAGASEVNPTATYSASSQIMACLASSYSGVDATVQIDVGPSLWTTEDPGDTTVIAPSVTTTLDGAMLVNVATADDDDAFTQPSGMTLVDNLEFNSMTTASAYELIATAGAAGDKTWTFAQNTDEITAVSFALRPAVGGSGISIAATLGAIEYNSNDTVIGLTGNVDIAATLGAINYSSNDTSIQVSGDVNVIATLGTISYASNDTAISLFGNIDVTATLGTIDYNSNDANISLLGGINVNATLGAIDYTSNNTAITLQGQTALTTTLGAISYDSNSVIVQVGTGQVIGNVTAGFADNLYSAGFKPSEITVNFKT